MVVGAFAGAVGGATNIVAVVFSLVVADVGMLGEMLSLLLMLLGQSSAATQDAASTNIGPSAETYTYGSIIRLETRTAVGILGALMRTYGEADRPE